MTKHEPQPSHSFTQTMMAFAASSVHHVRTHDVGVELAVLDGHATTVISAMSENEDGTVKSTPLFVVVQPWMVENGTLVASDGSLDLPEGEEPVTQEDFEANWPMVSDSIQELLGGLFQVHEHPHDEVIKSDGTVLDGGATEEGN